MIDIPGGFEPAGFSAGFLDLSGPYYLRSAGSYTIVGLEILEKHINYIDVAHGGVLTTFADVAMSFQVHNSERPQIAVATNSLTTNFLSGARLGDWLEAHCRIDRIGKRIAYVSGEMRRDPNIVMTMTGVFTILRQN